MKRENPPILQSGWAAIQGARGNILEDKFDFTADSRQEDIMYVLYNKMQVYGAAYLFDEKTMATVAEKLQGNLYIIPSSIHELMIVPESAALSPDDLRSSLMVGNQATVTPEELLSDEIYYYNRKAGTVEIIPEAGIEQDMDQSM